MQSRLPAWLAVLCALAASAAEPEAPDSVEAPVALEGIAVVALAEGNRLLRFDAARPGEVESLPIRGASGVLLGIDRRPADGRLYAVSDANDLYTVDAASGVAERVSTLTQGFEGSPRSGFDWNPQADRLRLVAASGQNLRVHVALGAVAVDGPLAYVAGDPNAGERPRVGAVAYTNNVTAAPSTRLFDIDWELDVLALQDPPNDGGLQTVGALGVDFEAEAGFDIWTAGDGAELALAASGGRLYQIDLASGRALDRGAIGDGSVRPVGIAIAPRTAP